MCSLFPFYYAMVHVQFIFICEIMQEKVGLYLQPSYKSTQYSCLIAMTFLDVLLWSISGKMISPFKKLWWWYVQSRVRHVIDIPSILGFLKFI